MDLVYAGIGSRETPSDVMDEMFRIARYLAQKGALLRSGGAQGADTAFELGARDGKGYVTIYRPNSREVRPWWAEEAKKFHPAWDKCSVYAKQLHARNTPIILGPVMTPFGFPQKTNFVVCWTKNGKATGGTGQALRIAEHYKIPVFNLFNSWASEELASYLEERSIL